MMACRQKRDASIVQTLLKAGADPGLRDKMGHAAIHHAVFQGNEDVIHYFKEAGANLDICTDSGCPPLQLHYAVKHNSCPELRLLAKSGANLDAQDSSGNTPLHIAALTSNRHAIQILLSFNAKTHIANHNNHIPLVLARSRRVGEEQEEYMKGPILSDANNHEKSALIIAIEHDDSRMFQRFCVNELVNTPDDNGRPPLHAACTARTAYLKMLLKAGANLHARDNRGNTPYVLAIVYNRYTASQYLMKKAQQQSTGAFGP